MTNEARVLTVTSCNNLFMTNRIRTWIGSVTVPSEIYISLTQNWERFDARVVMPYSIFMCKPVLWARLTFTADWLDILNKLALTYSHSYLRRNHLATPDVTLASADPKRRLHTKVSDLTPKLNGGNRFIWATLQVLSMINDMSAFYLKIVSSI